MIISGKRKRAIAKARIVDGTGKVYVNRMPYQMLDEMDRLMIQEPIEIAKEKLGELKHDIFVSVAGGGKASKIEVARLAVARALVKMTKSQDLKKAYVAYDRALLVADTRRKEPYKPNDSKARAKRQKSYR